MARERQASSGRFGGLRGRSNDVRIRNLEARPGARAGVDRIHDNVAGGRAAGTSACCSCRLRASSRLADADSRTVSPPINWRATRRGRRERRGSSSWCLSSRLRTHDDRSVRANRYEAFSVSGYAGEGVQCGAVACRCPTIAITAVHDRASDCHKTSASPRNASQPRSIGVACPGFACRRPVVPVAAVQNLVTAPNRHEAIAVPGYARQRIGSAVTRRRPGIPIAAVKDDASDPYRHEAFSIPAYAVEGVRCGAVTCRRPAIAITAVHDRVARSDCHETLPLHATSQRETEPDRPALLLACIQRSPSSLCRIRPQHPTATKRSPFQTMP